MTAAEYERSRRDAVKLGIAAGGTVLAASAAPLLLLKVSQAFAQAEDDASILEAAIGLEQQAVLAYAAAVGSGKLDAKTKRAAQLFGAQEQEHADALIAALKDIGGERPRQPTSAVEVPGLEQAVGGSQADIARFAVELETMAVKAYFDAVAKLKNSALVASATRIMANEAQHLVVLRQALRQNPSPDAFVTGRG